MYFFIWKGSEENLKRFFKELNDFHPSITFTFEKSKMKVNFSDAVIKIKNRKLSTDPYSKPVDSPPVDSHHYNSGHAQHIKKYIIYSQTLRLRRIWSERKDLKCQVKEQKRWFLRRGYPQQIVEEQMDRAFRLPLKYDTQHIKMVNGIPLVVTFNPAFRNLSTILRRNFDILYSDAEVRTVFTPSLFAAYRSTGNHKRFLVRSKFYPLERAVDSLKCGSKRCQVCSNVSKTDIFESLQTKKTIRLIITLIVMKNV